MHSDLGVPYVHLLFIKKKKVKHSEDQIINTALFKLYIKLVYRHSRTCLHLPDINYLFYSLPVQ